MAEIHRVQLRMSRLFREINKRSFTVPSRGLFNKMPLVSGELHIWQRSNLHRCLQRFFEKSKQKKKRWIFTGFSRTKVTSMSHQRHHTLGKDAYHSSDNQPDGSNTIPKSSVLISTVHSNLGNLTPSLNVFLFLFFSLFQVYCLQNALCRRGHENALTKIQQPQKNKQTKTQTIKTDKNKLILFHHLRCH